VEILDDSFPLAATQGEGSRISGALSLACTFGAVGAGLENLRLGVKGWRAASGSDLPEEPSMVHFHLTGEATAAVIE
jgi:hypothetical protein